MASINKLQRALNPDSAQTVTIALNVRMIEIVNCLYATGLYGGSASEVVNRVFCEGLQKHADKIKPN